MHAQLFQQSMDQPVLAANPTRGQLNGKYEFGRPAPARSFFCTLWMNLVLTHGAPPAFRDGIHIYHQPPTGQSRVNRILQLLTDGVHCRESAGTGPVVLKVVTVTSAAILQITIDQLMCTCLFPHTQAV